MFRRKPKEPEGDPQWLIVGLGNPGPEYRGTRHNLGFEVMDLVAQQARIKLDRSKHQARFGVGRLNGVDIALIKPLTYMNLSGRAVSPLAKQFHIAPDHILVISDDTDLAPARVRLKPKGAAGGHNGHKSIIESLGTTDYPRLKIGIGRVDKESTIDHVLSGFSPDERKLMDEALAKCVKTIEILVEEGLEAALNYANA